MCGSKENNRSERPVVKDSGVRTLISVVKQRGYNAPCPRHCDFQRQGHKCVPWIASASSCSSTAASLAKC